MRRSAGVAGLLALAVLLATAPGTAGGGTTTPPLYGVAWQGSLGLVRVDPGTLRPLPGRRTLGRSLQAGERFRGSLLLVLGPRGRAIGPSRLVQVEPDGGARSAPLPEIRSGTESDGRVTRSWDPGLAVDRRGGRAFVVQAGAPVAEVDLRTLEVRSRPLEPEARAADALAGPARDAIWLGRGLLALTGSDSHSRADERQGGSRGGMTPAGLTLVDTRRWRARTIDTRTTDAVLVSGTLLASSFLDRGRAGSGLTGYSLDGRRRFHLFGDAPIWGVQAVGRSALAGGPRGIALVDARTGRRLQSYRRLAMSLLSGDAPVLY